MEDNNAMEIREGEPLLLLAKIMEAVNSDSETGRWSLFAPVLCVSLPRNMVLCRLTWAFYYEKFTRKQNGS